MALTVAVLASVCVLGSGEVVVVTCVVRLVVVTDVVDVVGVVVSGSKGLQSGGSVQSVSEMDQSIAQIHTRPLTQSFSLFSNKPFLESCFQRACIELSGLFARYTGIMFS